MKVYIDLLFLLNFYIDFFLLLITSLILKRKTRIIRLFLGGIVGGCSVILLILHLNNFFFKFLYSILIILSTFSYHDFRYFLNNLIYLYLNSIILGGGLYLINLEFNTYNIIIILLFSVILLFGYARYLRLSRNNYNNYCDVEIIYKNNTYSFTGYVDSGNKLYDNYKNRPVSLIYTDKIKYDDSDIIYVTYENSSSVNVLKCLRVDMKINSNIYHNTLVGFMNKKINIDGIDVLLNNEYGGI